MKFMHNLSTLSTNLFCRFSEASTINLDLRVVYNNGHFTEATQAKEFLKTQIQDLADVFGKIKIGFNVEYNSGTATEKAANGDYKRIATGAKEGIINAYLYYDKNSHYDISWFNTESDQIFLKKSAFTKSRGLGKESLSHEMAHLFGIRGNLTAAAVKIFGDNGNNVVTNTIDNITSDFVLGTANAWCRNGYALYGRDWVDDYRNATQIILGEPNESIPRTPTVLDIYRVAAKRIASQAK